MGKAIVVGPELPELTTEQFGALAAQLYIDWEGANLFLERLGYPVIEDGTFVPMSDRIERLMNELRRTGTTENTDSD